MKTIYKNKSKIVTTEEFIQVMEKTRLLAESRTRTFNDNYKNYYWSRLKYLNDEFKKQYLFGTSSSQN
jgi:hypothetical protein